MGTHGWSSTNGTLGTIFFIFQKRPGGENSDGVGLFLNFIGRDEGARGTALGRFGLLFCGRAIGQVGTPATTTVEGTRYPSRTTNAPDRPHSPTVGRPPAATHSHLPRERVLWGGDEIGAIRSPAWSRRIQLQCGKF